MLLRGSTVVTKLPASSTTTKRVAATARHKITQTSSTFVPSDFTSKTREHLDKVDSQNTSTENQIVRTAQAIAEEAPIPKEKKSMAQMDEELKQKLAGISGDGGEAGLELEDGKPVAMKRSVKNNMFRLI